ncbi:hypothetical protein AB0J77_14835 [Micromonospora tulbaghiae]|uniref:hypothetical protein n=1 Tax=Micromonospora tulbaghiae TaxID=479978 RepID=UPI00343F6406
MSKSDRATEQAIADHDRRTKAMIREKAAKNGDYIGTLLDTVRREAGPRPEGYR